MGLLACQRTAVARVLFTIITLSLNIGNLLPEPGTILLLLHLLDSLLSIEFLLVSNRLVIFFSDGIFEALRTAWDVFFITIIINTSALGTLLECKLDCILHVLLHLLTLLIGQLGRVLEGIECLQI